jgi:hypothetical protein
MYWNRGFCLAAWFALAVSLPTFCQQNAQNDNLAHSTMTAHQAEPASTATAGSSVQSPKPAASGQSSHPKREEPVHSDRNLNPPTSLLDAIPIHVVRTTYTVEVKESEPESDGPEPQPFEAGSEEVVISAGSYGDIMRFLQVIPGVVATSDTSNEVLVRGGHPIENLYLVDGIEIPNINHLATLGTTGGFAPMIDAAAVQGLKLYTGGYEAKYSQRLSSVTEITLHDPGKFGRHAEADFGIQGVGGLIEHKLFGGHILSSAHHGLLDVVTKNAGLNGVPTYTNALTRFRASDGSGNSLTLLNVAGWDSISVTPCQADALETSEINSQYSAWRETSGAVWQHVFSPRTFGVGTVTDSEQVEHIHQQDQFLSPSDAVGMTWMKCPLPASVVHTTPVYMEDSNGAVSSAAYRYEFGSSKIAVSFGGGFWLPRPQYQIVQPIGAYSPYSPDPVRTDSTTFKADFAVGESGSFGQFTYHPFKALAVSGGGRLQTFAFGHHTTITPMLNLRCHLGESMAAHVAFASYAQLPPYVYLLAFPGNRSMSLMRVNHKIIGLNLDMVPSSRILLEAYDKEYSDIPSSPEYPSVTLHSMAELLGEQFVWLPLNSIGKGRSSGLELSDITNLRSNILIRASVAYSRAKFAGLDGRFRSSNFDFPWIVNLASTAKLGGGVIVSGRYGFESGKPYTPYDSASLLQNRPIYDLARVNAVRAPFYSRLDGQITKDVSIKGRHLELYGGVDNILNRSNFLTYAWMPLLNGHCPISGKELYQMPIFPNFGARLVYR